MKISEISAQAGVTGTTLKYYIREGLVPEGERVGTNKTVYTDAHVQRTRLARALIETGGMSVAAARQVLAALDSHTHSLAYVFEAAQHALRSGTGTSTPPSQRSRDLASDVIASQSWAVTEDNPGYAMVAGALDGFGTVGYTPSSEYLAGYADAAAAVARADLAALRDHDDPAQIAELMVVGTVMGDTLFAGLRRLAQQHETTLVFPVAEDAQEGDES